MYVNVVLVLLHAAPAVPSNNPRFLTPHQALSLQDQALFKSVDATMSASSNFSAYRRIVATVVPPAVPYFGPFSVLCARLLASLSVCAMPD